MILETFSQVLQCQWCPDGGPRAYEILHTWLMNHLCNSQPHCQIGHVLHTEVEMIDAAGHVGFIGRSKTGKALLRSLYLYCDSYEQWQFSRWLHEAKPASFS